jgi:hypothetical protein
MRHILLPVYPTLDEEISVVTARPSPFLEQEEKVVHIKEFRFILTHSRQKKSTAMVL